MNETSCRIVCTPLGCSVLVANKPMGSEHERSSTLLFCGCRGAGRMGAAWEETLGPLRGVWEGSQVFCCSLSLRHPPLTVCGGKSPVWPPLEDRRGTGGVRGRMLGFADAEPWTSCGWKNQAELSVSDTLFQTDFISGDPVVPGAEQGMFFIWFMSWASSPPGEMGVR